MRHKPDTHKLKGERFILAQFAEVSFHSLLVPRQGGIVRENFSWHGRREAGSVIKGGGKEIHPSRPRLH